MALQDKIDHDLKEAMTQRDTARVSTLRFLISALKYRAIEKRVQDLPDADVQAVLRKQIKQRKESIDQFSKAGRQELADKELRELKILESYLTPE